MILEPPKRRCVGSADLFLSTHPTDHNTAKRFCGDCDAFAWCQLLTRRALADPSYGLGVEGTWAGVLYRNGREVTAMERRGRRAVGA